MQPRRIHVSGGPDSGKTRLAQRIAAEPGLAYHELGQFYAARLPIHEQERKAVRMAEADAWVSDGTYFRWAEPLFQRADVVVWLDVPWRVAAHRITVRHLWHTVPLVPRLAPLLALLPVDAPLLHQYQRQEPEPRAHSEYTRRWLAAIGALSRQALGVPFQRRHQGATGAADTVMGP